MKSKLLFLVSLLFITSVAFAETKEYAVLGGQIIKSKVRDGQPLPAEKNGITVVGLALRSGTGN